MYLDKEEKVVTIEIGEFANKIYTVAGRTFVEVDKCLLQEVGDLFKGGDCERG